MRIFLLATMLLLIVIQPGCNRQTTPSTPEIPLHVATIPTVQTADWANAGEWWIEQHNSFNRIAEIGNIEIVFLGDSITQLWKIDGETIWNDYYASREAVNFGIGGDQTQHLLWRIDNGNLDGFDAKLVVLLIGINNVYAGHSPQQIADGIEAIIHKIQQKQSDAQLLLLGIFPSSKNAHDPYRQASIETNKIIQGFVDSKGIHCLDISSVFLNEDGIISETLMPDSLHLSEKGYLLWAEAMEPIMINLLT